MFPGTRPRAWTTDVDVNDGERIRGWSEGRVPLYPLYPGRDTLPSPGFASHLVRPPRWVVIELGSAATLLWAGRQIDGRISFVRCL